MNDGRIWTGLALAALGAGIAVRSRRGARGIVRRGPEVLPVASTSYPWSGLEDPEDYDLYLKRPSGHPWDVMRNDKTGRWTILRPVHEGGRERVELYTTDRNEARQLADEMIVEFETKNRYTRKRTGSLGVVRRAQQSNTILWQGIDTRNRELHVRRPDGSNWYVVKQEDSWDWSIVGLKIASDGTMHKVDESGGSTREGAREIAEKMIREWEAGGSGSAGIVRRGDRKKTKTKPITIHWMEGEDVTQTQRGDGGWWQITFVSGKWTIHGPQNGLRVIWGRTNTRDEARKLAETIIAEVELGSKGIVRRGADPKIIWTGPDKTGHINFDDNLWYEHPSGQIWRIQLIDREWWISVDNRKKIGRAASRHQAKVLADSMILDGRYGSKGIVRRGPPAPPKQAYTRSRLAEAIWASNTFKTEDATTENSRPFADANDATSLVLWLRWIDPNGRYPRSLCDDLEAARELLIEAWELEDIEWMKKHPNQGPPFGRPIRPGGSRGVVRRSQAQPRDYLTDVVWACNNLRSSWRGGPPHVDIDNALSMLHWLRWNDSNGDYPDELEDDLDGAREYLKGAWEPNDVERMIEQGPENY